jgi:putative phage-type endonuclease
MKIAEKHIQNQNEGIYPDQKSDKWQAARLNMLTASDCASALDCNPYESSQELLIRKVSELKDLLSFSKTQLNSNMAWGNKYEPVAKTLYESLSDKVHEIGLVTHPIYKWLGASPDGILSSGKLLEIKCPVSRNIGEVPYYYWIQVQIQLEVCNLDECDFMDCKFIECSKEQYDLMSNKTMKGVIQSMNTKQYWSVKNYFIHNIKRDQVWFRDNINYLNIFWDKVILYRKKGWNQNHENSQPVKYQPSYVPLPISSDLSSHQMQNLKRRANVLQDAPENILPNSEQILSRPAKKQRVELIYFNSKLKSGELINWNKWVSATKTRNYIIEDPLIDWLEYHGNQHTYLNPTANVNNSILRANYDVGTQFESDFRNSMIFTSFLKENGVKFEKYVIKDLFSRFSNDILTIANQYQARSTKKYEETISAMKEGIPIIHHGVLHNYKNRTYGMPDLIVRSDWLNKIFIEPIISETRMKDRAISLSLPMNKSWHYRIVDIKFTTLGLRADGKHLLKNSSVEAMKSQLYVYNMALHEIQGYNPAKAYIIGRKWNFKKNNVISSGNNWFTKAGHINFKTIDKHIRTETKNALAWIHNVRSNGHGFTVNPPSCPEMYPNMCNGLDGPWRRVKDKIARELFEITLLWQCGLKNRKSAHSKNVFNWNDPRCISETMGVRGDRVISTLQQILDCNKDQKKNISDEKVNEETTLNTEDFNEISNNYDNLEIIIPHKIHSNLLRQWHGPKNLYKNKKILIFVDFEVITDLTLDDSLAGSSYLFMIGIKYRIISTQESVYKCFYTNDLSQAEERRIFLELHEFIWKFSNKKKGKFILPDLVHWSHAERTFYNAAWNKHGCAVIKAGYQKIDTWRDMLKIFKDEPITIRGALNFSLKSIAKAFHSFGFIQTIWDENGVCDGMGAMILAYNTYQSAKQNNIFDIMTTPDMRNIRDYNEVDVTVMYEILMYLVQHH